MRDDAVLLVRTIVTGTTSGPFEVDIGRGDLRKTGGSVFLFAILSGGHDIEAMEFPIRKLVETGGVDLAQRLDREIGDDVDGRRPRGFRANQHEVDEELDANPGVYLFPSPRIVATGVDLGNGNSILASFAKHAPDKIASALELTVLVK